MSTAELSVLERRSYTIDDLRTWRTILTEPDPAVAAAALLDTTKSHVLGANSVPVFVVLIFLLRSDFTASAVRDVLQYCWYLAKRRQVTRDQEKHNTYEHHHPSTGRLRIGSDSSINEIERTEARGISPFGGCEKAPVDNHSLFILVVRLLRQARRYLPEAFESIAALAKAVILTPTNGDFVVKANITEKSVRNNLSKTFKCRRNLTSRSNRLLKLFSEPSPIHPFLSSVFQEKSQFLLLRSMMEHEPALTITREGYRSFTRVQLARRKTMEEAEWARLKSEAWPPWKADRLGIDADKTVEDGYSKAMQSLMHAREAGYGAGPWDHLAQVYSGWSLDRTPTIQTRKNLRLERLFVSDTISSPVEGAGTEPVYAGQVMEQLWTARISTTRTLREAWAIFLAYEDSKALPSQVVYLAMFRKINRAEQRQSSHSWATATTTKAQPGDGREVWPEPPSAHLITYVRSEPPTMLQLFERMLNHGLTPSGPCLYFLVEHASSLDEGLKYLGMSGRSLLQLVQNGSEDAQAQMSRKEISSVVILLCRFPDELIYQSLGTADVFEDHSAGQPKVSLSLACQLLVHLKSRSPKPWYMVLRALTERRLSWHSSSGQAFLRRAAHYQLQVQSTLRSMAEANVSLGDRGLNILCHGLQQTFRELRPMQTSRHYREALRKARHTLRMLRVLFQRVFAGKRGAHALHSIDDLAAEKKVPRLLASPQPATLHFYARSLGWAMEYEGLLSLVKWMIDYQAELDATILESPNSQKQLRYTIVAVSMFLTHSEGIEDFSEDKESSSERRDEVCLLVKQLLPLAPQWGEWPEEDEILEYRDAFIEKLERQTAPPPVVVRRRDI